MSLLEDGTEHSPLFTVPLRRTEPLSPERRLLREPSRGFRYTTIMVRGLWHVPLVGEDG